MSYNTSDGEVVLEAIALPHRPNGFLNISDPNNPGRLVLGHSSYIAKEIHLTNIFQRQYGNYEEFILAMLSVFLIVILSELVMVILMRRRESRISTASLRAACLLDDTARFRMRIPVAETRRRRMWANVLTIGISVMLFVADVVSVLLTQPKRVRSSKHGFNVKGVQPIGLSRDFARALRRETENFGCVSGLAEQAETRRLFLVTGCVGYKFVRVLDGAEDEVREVRVRTFWHRAGSDHRIWFGEGSYNVTVRGFMGSEGDGMAGRHILFETRDDANMSQAGYLHRVFGLVGLEYVCNRSRDLGRGRSCEEFAEEMRVVKVRRVRERVKLWRGAQGDVGEEVEGLESVIGLRLYAPFRAVHSAVRVLVTTGMVEEVEGRGMYVRFTDEVEEDGVEGLVEEDGRFAGVVLFGAVVGLLAGVLVVLRVALRPVHLTDVVRGRMGEEWELYGVAGEGRGEGIGARYGGRGMERYSFDEEMGAVGEGRGGCNARVMGMFRGNVAEGNGESYGEMRCWSYEGAVGGGVELRQGGEVGG